jgi:hypothetical protein
MLTVHWTGSGRRRNLEFDTNEMIDTLEGGDSAV